jgi:hypothetical protein
MEKKLGGMRPHTLAPGAAAGDTLDSGAGIF